MSTINTLLTPHSDFQADAQADMQVEMKRHAFDLRVHALIMLFSGALVSYSAFQIVDVDRMVSEGQPEWIGLQPDLLAIFALTVLVAIASFCFFEARRCWKRAAKTKIRHGRDRDSETTKVGSPPRPQEGGASERLLGLFAVVPGPVSVSIRRAA